MAELNVQQKNIVNQLRQAYPELKSYSDEQILSLYNEQLNNIQLSEDEKISIMNGKNGVVNDGMEIQLETSPKAVSKEQEAQLKSALTARLNAVSTNVKKAEDSNGFLGKAWSWTKNTFNFGDSSNKVREQQKADLKALESGNIAEAFKQITGLDYTVENVNKFLNNEVQTKSETALNGYTEGQDMASDVIADIASGIAAVGIYTAAVAAAPFTGGASIVVGVAAAGASAAAIKTGIKYADAKSGCREYTADNLKKDLATGAFSGVLAPITGGMGGAVGKTVATKVGIQAVKQVGKEVAEEAVEQTAKGFVKTALTNPYGYEYIGGNVLKRAGAYSAEMITDGAVSGFFDSAFRTAYDGGSIEEVGEAAVMGGVSGGAGAWFLGGGIKVFGRGMQKIFGKNNIQIDAQGNRVRVNDDGTVIRIDENGNEIGDAIVRNTDSGQLSITDRLTTASSREEFVAIRDEIKAMPAGAEKTALQQEYLRKWNEFSRKYNEEFDIRMEYKPEVENSTRANIPAGIVMPDEIKGSSLGVESVKKSISLNLDELRTQKNQWGSSRFKESDLVEISNYMVQDADLTRFMLEYKNSSGDFEYSSYDIKNVFALKEKYPEIAEIVKIGGRIPSYKWEDFCKIMQEDREFAMKLLNLKDGNDEFMLTPHDCLESFSIAKNDQENALRLLSTLDKDGTPRVSSYHLKELLDMNKSNPKLFSIIFNRKDTAGNYSFFPYNITTLQDAFNEIPEMLEKFLTMTDKTGKLRFGEFEIEDLCKVPQEKRKQLLEFLEMNNLDGEYRFEYASSAIKLLQYDGKEQFINELISLKNSRGKERFSIHEIESILEFATDENIPRIKELIVAKNNEGYEYDVYIIKSSIELEEKAPDLFKELHSMRDYLGNVRFSMATTKDIIEHYEKIPYVRTLINEKLDDGNYRFGNELSSFIDNMSIFGERKIKMLAELKDSKGNYRLEGKEIEHIIKSGNPLKQVLEILKIENSDGTSRYTAYDACELSTVIKGFEDEPEELIVKLLMEMNTPDGHKRFDGSTVWKLVSDYSEWKDIINQKLPNGEYKYTADMIAEMIIKGKEFQPVLDNIIAKCLELDSPYEKILTDPVTGQYIVESANNNFVYFDKDGNFIKIYIKEGERTGERTANGVEEVLTSSNHYKLRTSWEKLDDNFKQLTESIRVEYDADGNVLYKERYIQAPDVNGKYEIWRKDANGHKYKIGIAEKTPDGTIIIEKSLTSKDGVKTEYVYIEDVSGQRISQTRIKDKNGNIILDNRQKFKQIDENHFTSTENGVEYDIQYFEDRVVVTKNNSESVEISIGNNGSNTEGILSKELLSILKQMPGSVYFKIKKHGLKKIGKEIDFVDEQNAHYSLNKNLISLSNELSTKDEIFVLMHELGHYIDYSEGIHTNKELLKIYERERKALFDSSTPSEINALDYFVQINHINNGGAITELIAEVNALLHTNNNASRLELRGQYLQQYFPETFAFIARELNKIE